MFPLIGVVLVDICVRVAIVHCVAIQTNTARLRVLDIYLFDLWYRTVVQYLVETYGTVELCSNACGRQRSAVVGHVISNMHIIRSCTVGQVINCLIFECCCKEFFHALTKQFPL